MQKVDNVDINIVYWQSLRNEKSEVGFGMLSLLGLYFIVFGFVFCRQECRGRVLGRFLVDFYDIDKVLAYFEFYEELRFGNKCFFCVVKILFYRVI